MSANDLTSQPIPNQLCPQCHHPIDIAAPFSHKGLTRSPIAHDLCVCLMCAKILQFQDDLTLRLFPDEDFSLLPMETRNGLMAMINIIGEIHRELPELQTQKEAKHKKRVTVRK